MKSKKISIFFVLIIKSLTLVNPMRTNGNIPQYHSLRSFKIKDYRIKRAKSPVCYNPNCVATYNDILECGDKKKKNPGRGFDRQSRKKHNATTKESASKKASSTKCPVCNKSGVDNRKQLLCLFCLELNHVTCSNVTTEMKNKITAVPIN